MKKRNLLIGLALAAGFVAQAAESPYTGSVVGEGTYYLYQVETGKWLQTNRQDINQWTTMAKLDDVGFDVELKKIENYEGYQIFCRMTNNGSLNGALEDRFFLDQADRDITDWIFEPAEVEGVTNAYKIMAKATPEGTAQRSAIPQDFYIGAADEMLSDAPTETTWQLVSREERIEKMLAAAANGPVDASWLIPWNDRGRNDLRDQEWTRNITDNYVGGNGFDGALGYPVQERWHQILVNESIKLTNIPNGTYEFYVQAFYRDGGEGAINSEVADEERDALGERYNTGTEVARAFYYAGANEAPIMSIFADAKDAQQDGFGCFIPNAGDAGKWLPGSVGESATAMYNGNYINEPIKVSVSDGTLTVGIKKESGEHHDWLIYKRFYLRYVSADVEAEDLSGLQAQLNGLIEEAKELPQTPTFAEQIAAAQSALATATSSSALLDAINKFQGEINVIKSAEGAINTFYATKEITDGLGLDTSAAQLVFDTATTTGAYNDALRDLRYARRYAAADKHEDVFVGAEPVDGGKFYLYNIGRKQFLCGGSDWGAHAALGFPGIEITLEVGEGTVDGSSASFYIETGLLNGDKHHLNYRGYMDAPKIDDFAFIPVAGKENVYNIIQADYMDVYVGWDPYALVDAGNADETTVRTENVGRPQLNPNDPNNQWKLVTRAERDALIANASLDNPVDISYQISRPNFNQRESSSWSVLGTNPEENFVIFGEGGNYNDFIAETWNCPAETELGQMFDVPDGVYQVSVQGFYRNGCHQTIGVEGEEGYVLGQPDCETAQNAILYAGEAENDVLLPNITAEDGNAPGEGADATATDGTVTYHYPREAPQAAAFFKSGLYKTTTVAEVTGGMISFGIIKTDKGNAEDWIVVDNFRIVYYGPNTTKEAVLDKISGIEDIEIDQNVAPEDDRIFNLQGIQVTNPTVPGIYIRNGKKFIVR